MVNTTHCNVCNHEYKYYKKHLQSRKHKKNKEGILGYAIENNDEAFKGYMKIRLFRFKESTPTSIIEAIDMVKPSIEILIKNTLSKINTFKVLYGSKIEYDKKR